MINAWPDLDQLARDANTGDPVAVQRLRDAASEVMDPFPLLEIIDRYPTGEEATEILAKRVIELDEINERAWQALASVYDLYDGQWLNERV